MRGEAYEVVLDITLYSRVSSDVAFDRFERSAGKFEVRENSKTRIFKYRRFGQLENVSKGNVVAGTPPREQERRAARSIVESSERMRLSVSELNHDRARYSSCLTGEESGLYVVPTADRRFLVVMKENRRSEGKPRAKAVLKLLFQVRSCSTRQMKCRRCGKSAAVWKIGSKPR